VAKQSRVSVANASHHLQKLKSVRLVASRKDGQHVVYRLGSEKVEALWQCLQMTGEDRLLEVQELVRTFVQNRDDLEPVTREALLEKLGSEEMVLLDARPEDEYIAGHLPGAISIDPKELAERLSELPKEKTIIAYCRGPYCMFSFDAVELLRAKGYTALRLQDGFPEWKAENLPIETGQQGSDT